MFIDRVKVFIKAGDGGNGMIAFHREKFVERGGPSGGDGGRGGSIYFIADTGLSTLLDFKYRRKIEGNSGGKGMGKNSSGKSGEDLYVKVPVGSVVVDNRTKRVIADLKKPNQVALIAKGGRGGRGNAKFASPANQVPKVAENGFPGIEFDATIELKLLADVGLVGFPSVGKSTLLSVVSAAKPEIAEYHFTTIIPNLGVVKVNQNKNFVMADLPGLIEGAHQGKGLGLHFLRHIERCRVLVHVIDMSSTEGRDPFDDFMKINNELTQYGMRLMDRPMIIAANKMDDDGAILLLEDFKIRLAEKNLSFEIFEISALARTGLESLIYRISELLETTPEFPLINEDQLSDIFVYEAKDQSKGFVIHRESEDTWVISGERIEKIFKVTNITTDEGLMYLLSIMRKMEIEEELIRMGIRNGDTVRLCSFEFQYFE